MRSWPGYQVFREVRELTMTTWLAQNTSLSREVDHEVALRLASLRSGEQDRAWTHSDRRIDGPAPPPPPAFDPFADRQVIRVTNVYGTSWQVGAGTQEAVPLADSLRFGRLTRFYRASADQLPVVLAQLSVDPAAVRCPRWRGTAIVDGRIWLFSVPPGQVATGLSLDVDCSLLGVIDLLEDCYYLDTTIGEHDLETVLMTEARSRGVLVDCPRLAPELHQLVFARKQTGVDTTDLLQRVIYRADLPYRPEYSAIAYPRELNRRPSTIAAVGPYVSVLCGQQDYLENAVFTSAVRAVASAVRAREIRDAAHYDLRQFRAAEVAHLNTHHRRHALERITDDLTRLELDLSVSVEAPRDLGALVPSLRAVGYHQQVYDASGLGERAATVGQMLRRLEATIRAELSRSRAPNAGQTRAGGCGGRSRSALSAAWRYQSR